ncbi:RB1-inducible coiled-coil protein 1 isoform X2 [Lutzomyia longipalpis]|uniref:RB1-inducible coiled-coil protein 1 isoform X2 n=1 Tax=Lutzomyia longipalpis TaxID=7200 RepID=UPI002483CB36|nr:RB1-inducible coiled-coil protein 1 isoform X2 [Lutzomyia longipalpis]
MLYVFHVDTGRMITFDMGVALENVQYLKEMIETHYHIPAASQVLLVSGGEMLSPQNRICSYLGGTDTNPIFMFSTNIIESKNPPQPWPSIEPDNDLKDQVERCLSLPANYNTVVKRAQLAQQIYELGREETRTCEKLVHEQHLQQQGWAAVVANMEDLTEEFKKRCSDFQNAFNEVLEKRIEYLECLSHFNEDLDKLSNIPILPALLQNAEKPFHAFDDVYENDSFQKGIEKAAEGGFPESSTRTTREGSAEETKSSSSSVKESEEKGEEGDDKVSVKAMTLLQWISAQENQISLRKMAAECLKSLEQFDEKEMTSLKTEVKNAIENAQKEDVKLIKGLEDRLSGLEKLMFDVKNIVKEQSELAQAFQQNQARANNLGDTSILPDLCVSHKNQLIVMRRNHKQLRDIRSRISRAKTELGHNLLQRLKYISYIENRMYEIDSKLLFIHRNCRRLQKHMGIIEQIHQAPSVYVTAVTEVVRRRTFSSAFLLWASDLASHLTTIYSEEVVRRQEFWSMFEGHFLCTLFPGIEDMPPSYATVAPSTFDASLPNLTRDDINELSDFGLKIELPDLSAVIDFFSSRSGGKNEDKSTLVDGDRTNGSTISRNVAVGTSDLPKILDMHSHLKDYERGFESETDTEEFEKVGQSPIDRRRISTTGSLQAYTTLATSTQTSLAPVMTSLSKPEMCNISTSTEVVVTQTIETLTESTLSIPSKKNPRLNKLNVLNSMKSLDSNNSLTFSTGSTLPSIPEITSPSHNTDSDAQSVSASSQSADNSAECDHEISGKCLGHHPSSFRNQHGNLQTTLDSEFINSEFYIDESLPSSLSSDRIDGIGQNIVSPSDDKDKFHFAEEHREYDTVIKLLQENLGTTRCEVEKLKNLLRSLHAQSQAAIQVFREQIKDIRHDTESGKSDLDIQLKSLNDAWEMIKLEATNHQQELIKRTVDHELELNDLKKTLDTSNEMIVTLQNEKKNLEDDHKLAVKKYEVLMEEMQEKVKGLMEAADEYRAREVKVNEEKEKLTKEITEKLMREHKSELESLRSRYKLMTSIERSPSDTSLEKIERPDLLEMSGHEAVFQHTKDEFVAERGLAIKSTADRERSRWEHRSGLGQILLSGSPKSPSKAHDICKRIIEDKDNQLELMRQREEQLLKDINRHRETIQNLTEDDTNSVIAFKEKVDGLQKDKSRLEQELEMEKSKRLEMESSFAALKVVNPDSTAVSPDQMTRSGAKSKSSSSLGKGLITISTCSKGDLVIVVWNSIHEQYIIVQDTSILYFLHGESYNTLKLPRLTANETPHMIPLVAKVIEKEFCVARKDENRYKVSKGTKFYRVKVEPVSSTPQPLDAARSSRRHETTGIQSGSVGRSTSTELPSSSSVSQTSTHLIDSFAQTECPILIEDVSEAKDMVDSGVDAQQKSIYKERNVSVTEEDEPVSLSDQRCCNISVSEEDEEAANVENASERPSRGGSIGIFTLIESFLTPMQL